MRPVHVGIAEESGPIERVREVTAPKRPFRRLLVALVGLFRHHDVSLAALERQVIEPNEQHGMQVRIALFTANSTACSSSEQRDGHCRCHKPLPYSILDHAEAAYANRLLKVHFLLEHSSSSSRLAGAWTNGLRELSQQHDVTLLLRVDAKLTAPLDIREACGQAAATCTQSRGCHAKTHGWTGYLACSALAATLMLSSDLDDDEETPRMVADTLSDMGVKLQLVKHCPRGAAGAAPPSSTL